MDVEYIKQDQGELTEAIERYVTAYAKWCDLTFDDPFNQEDRTFILNEIKRSYLKGEELVEYLQNEAGYFEESFEYIEKHPELTRIACSIFENYNQDDFQENPGHCFNWAVSGYCGQADNLYRQIADWSERYWDNGVSERHDDAGSIFRQLKYLTDLSDLALLGELKRVLKAWRKR